MGFGVISAGDTLKSLSWVLLFLKSEDINTENLIAFSQNFKDFYFISSSNFIRNSLRNLLGIHIVYSKISSELTSQQ